MSAQPIYVSVTEPVNRAIERVKLLLFHPFDLGKWFTIGFGAWLATIGERGASFNFPSHKQYQPGDMESFRQWFDHAHNYVVNNLNWILPLAIAVVIFAFALGVLFTWLHSRGAFMFLHCVALNKAEIDVPWTRYAAAANSLFLFRLVLWLISLVPVVSLLVFTGITAIRLVHQGDGILQIVLGLMPLLLMLVAVGILFCVIRKLTVDFVVPIMMLRGTKCLAAWSEFLGLLSVNVGRFILYLLFQIVLAIVLGLIVVVAAVVTCCFCCLLLVPYISTVLLLPVLIFKRSYSLFYLAQYGPPYDVFAPQTTATSPQTPMA
ncbi:MAG TPA: hypothetical protein VMV72_18670 [Verrucomicrobiae bacterium]|nr:hypothetical protein [Verrucomicrobiae bacterium]